MSKYLWDRKREKTQSIEEKVDKIKEQESFDQEVTQEIEIEMPSNSSPQRRKKYKEHLKEIEGSKQLLIFVLVTLIFCLLFIPIYPVYKFNKTSLTYLDPSEVSGYNGVGKTFSPFGMIIYNLTAGSNNEHISSADTTYNLLSGTLNLTLKEDKIIAKTEDGTVYYYKDDSVKKTTDLDVVVPTLIGFSDTLLKEVISQLKDVDYNILIQFDSISLTPIDGDSDLCTIYVKDGSKIEIGVGQMAEKLKYFGQMQSIVEQKAKTPGLYHLDIGDYYEPF
ncbi:MAG: hypothetical protein ACK5HS_02310 [Mycoplasmatales bacterium]